MKRLVKNLSARKLGIKFTLVILFFASFAQVEKLNLLAEDNLTTASLPEVNSSSNSTTENSTVTTTTSGQVNKTQEAGAVAEETPVIEPAKIKVSVLDTHTKGSDSIGASANAENSGLLDSVTKEKNQPVVSLAQSVEAGGQQASLTPPAVQPKVPVQKVALEELASGSFRDTLRGNPENISFLRDDNKETASSQNKSKSSFDEDTRISLNLRNIDIIEALKFFSIKSGFNIVPTQKVGGRVTLTVENVAIRDIFDIMLRSNSLAYIRQGDIYNVMTEDEYRKFYGKNFSDMRQVKIFRLRYVIPEQAFNLLDAIKSEIGRLLVDSESGAVLLIDTPEKIKEAEETLNALEQKSVVKVFDLKYAKAKDIEDQLKLQLELKNVGIIKADTRTNQVVVQTLPDRMKNIEQIITSLDKKTKAVLIDVKIVKIRISDQNDTGVQWEGLFNIAARFGLTYLGSYPFSYMTAGITNPTFVSRYQNYVDNAKMAGSIGSYPFSGTTSSLNSSGKLSPGENMHIGVISKKQDFDVVVDYLQTLGKSKIMASPSLAVVNNQEAKIHIGERRAYVTTTTTQGATTTTTAEEVTYVDIGVRLSIIPTINDDGYVTLKIKPEISSVTGNITTASGNLVPIIDTNTAESTVLARDGATILLAGLGREEKTVSSEGLPYISKIPFLGRLFKNSSEKTELTELVIMLTPYISEGDALINPKEKEKLQLKATKRRFDVFKPEGEKDYDSEVFIPLDGDEQKDSFNSKKFKPYNSETENKTSASGDGDISINAPLPEASSSESKRMGIGKLNNLGLDIPGESGGGISAVMDKAFAPKGIRPYNK